MKPGMEVRRQLPWDPNREERSAICVADPPKKVSARHVWMRFALKLWLTREEEKGLD